MGGLYLEARDEEEVVIYHPKSFSAIRSPTMNITAMITLNRLTEMPSVMFHIKGPKAHNWQMMKFPINPTETEIGVRSQLNVTSFPVGAYDLMCCVSNFVCSTPVVILLLGPHEEMADASHATAVFGVAQLYTGVPRQRSSSAVAQRAVIDAALGGLRPVHRIVEIGCGTLGLAALLVPFINPGHYTCIETESWVHEAAMSVEPELVELFAERHARILQTSHDDFESTVSGLVRQVGHKVDLVFAHKVNPTPQPNLKPSAVL